MYRDIGEYISVQSENAEYGDAFVQKLADFFATNYPDLKGFNRRGLYRMKQFYELYKDNEKVSTLLTQLNWSNHLKIMSACKTMEERIFYMNMCVKEKYSARELARQIDSGYYERYMLSRKPLSPIVFLAFDGQYTFLGIFQEKIGRMDTIKNVLVCLLVDRINI